jgi:hypothetical protein
MTLVLRKEEQFSWTDEAVEILKIRWAEGAKARIIALEIGANKNAVIGKAHRLGLGAHVNGKGGNQNTVAVGFIVRKKPRAPRDRWKEKPLPIAEVIHIAPDPSCKVHFLDAGKRQCRYPLWGADYTPLEHKFCCGAVTPKDAVYCGFHHNITHYRAAAE